MNSIKHATTVLSGDWKKDGDMEAYCYRIPDTGAKEMPFLVSNPLGRIPVGVQTIMRNKNVNVYVSSVTETSITLKFTEDNCDVTIRTW